MIKVKIILLLFSSICSYCSVAQDTRFTGTWEGTLNIGQGLSIVFHIRDNGKGGYASKADSPDQFAYDLVCDTTIILGKELAIALRSLKASYAGTLIDDSTIKGVFTQQGRYNLDLKKKEKTVGRNRPQTPVPPFPYRSEDVLFKNADSSLTYGATITIPVGKGPFASLILITGSGPQDRDETIMGHKLFAVLADHLTKKGFIVLRIDDRGIGKSTGNFNTATSEDFASDASSAVDYLLARPEADKKKIGLLGHSEGGMIAPMIASRRKEIDFIILLAAPGVKIIDLMAEQNAAVARSSGVSEKAVSEIKPLFKKVVESIVAAPDSLTAQQVVTAYTEYWAGSQTEQVLHELSFETKEKRGAYITEMIKVFRTPWYRYFIAFDPAPYLVNLKTKILAVNGDRDIQVISKQNLGGIEAALKKSRSKEYTITELPGLNHLFQKCQSCTIMEYGILEETIAPAALETISNWLIKTVK